jgi:hypothetical protein
MARLFRQSSYLKAYMGVVMDQAIIDYLRSGNACVLIGSGPSIEMGYPTWRTLAESSIVLMRARVPPVSITKAEEALGHEDYPAVFEHAWMSLGSDQLLTHLTSLMIPSGTGQSYRLIARWPVPVYLTTNYDDEIQRSLVEYGESYIPYSNSEDHMKKLLPALRGAIYKLHGDLRSSSGLILTKSHYDSLQTDVAWAHWRTKMAAVFQMYPVIIVGHSLADANIRQVLEAAKQGSGINQPVCWIAPNVEFNQMKEYLENWRIRVVPYDNQDGSHRNLLRLLENISQFVFSRTSISIRKDYFISSKKAMKQASAAPGYYVFAKLSGQPNFHQLRIAAISAAILSLVPQLKTKSTFRIEDALMLAGWPATPAIPLSFAEEVVDSLSAQGIVTKTRDLLTLGPLAQESYAACHDGFTHTRERFMQALNLRIRRSYTSFTAKDAELLASDIESSLVVFFKEAGLTLATTLAASSRGQRESPVPTSILQFISDSANRYSNILWRQAFCTVAVDIFAQPEEPDKEYLGRVSQGFFSFHALGLFGDAAAARLSRAQDTVWIIDSSAQIPAFAVASPTHAVFNDCFRRLKEMGIRLFTTESLFKESFDHFYFASRVVREHGAKSQDILYAATGQTPFRKANVFLEGFIRWQAAGNPADWQQYETLIAGRSDPTLKDFKERLMEIGIEVIALDAWPGYIQEDVIERLQLQASIVAEWEARLRGELQDDPDRLADYYKKADPEAEALLVVLKERGGKYHMLSSVGQSSPSWFISQTSMLNLLSRDGTITWQPDAFLRFASTLYPCSDPRAADRAFEVLLIAFTEVGASTLDDKTLLATFGGVVDQASIALEEAKVLYDNVLGWKYGESVASIVSRLPPMQRPLASLQLAKETIQVQMDKSKYAEQRAATAEYRAASAEKKLQNLEHIERMISKKRREREIVSRKKKARKASGHLKKPKKRRR